MSMNTRFPRFLGLWFLLAALLLPGRTWAQWETQAIPLQAGWNAVFLLVDPSPEDCDTIFASTSFVPKTVRTYKHDFTSKEITSVSPDLLNTAPEWLTWLPPSDPAAFTRNLFALKGGRAFFIELPAGAPNVTWNLRGRPLARPLDWKGNAFNLVGFRLDSASPPTFQTFFAPSTLHAGQSIFRMNAAGVWTLVSSPSTTPMARGEAFWMFLPRPSAYQAPVRVETDQGQSLDFGRSLSEINVRLFNESTTVRTVRLTARASETQPASFTNVVHAGAVPLLYWQGNNVTRVFGWQPFGQLDVTLAAGERLELRVAVNRAAMVPLQPPLRGLYQSLLDVTEIGGPSRHTLPVTARGLEVFDAAGNPVHPFAGMWVGYASVNKVNEPGSPLQPTLPVSTATDFTFRLLVHVDGAGQARLLPWVIEMFKEGVLAPNPENPAQNLLVTPGRQVWVTNRNLIPNFSGATLRDGEPVGRRLSAVAFGFEAPVTLSGGAFGSGTIGTSLAMDHNHRLNPFKHKFHPDHDNLNLRFDGPLPEAFDFTRAVSLEFTPVDPEGRSTSGFGETLVGGVYREAITGLTAPTLHVQGIFRLHQVARTPVLNDGL
jgi:hypothetical protein